MGIYVGLAPTLRNEYIEPILEHIYVDKECYSYAVKVGDSQYRDKIKRLGEEINAAFDQYDTSFSKDKRTLTFEFGLWVRVHVDMFTLEITLKDKYPKYECSCTSVWAATERAKELFMIHENSSLIHEIFS